VVVAAGAAILATGLCLTAVVDDLWLAYLTYAIGAGFGGACCYIPTISMVGGWFVRQRNTALGVAAAGTGGGTFAIPPMTAVLTEHYGWRASYVALGLAGATILLACAILRRVR
jgi:MFS family permease